MSGKPHSLLSQAIQIGCGYFLLAKTTYFRPPQIICQYKDNVGVLFFNRGGSQHKNAYKKLQHHPAPTKRKVPASANGAGTFSLN
jgi:hypothetical protein